MKSLKLIKKRTQKTGGLIVVSAYDGRNGVVVGGARARTSIERDNCIGWHLGGISNDEEHNMGCFLSPSPTMTEGDVIMSHSC